MKKKLMLLLLAGCCILPITSCGSEEAQESTVVKEEKTYLTETEISSLFSDPEAYKGKYVKLDGQIFTSPEQDEDGVALQVWHDPQNASNNFIVYVNGNDTTFNQNDYISVDGEILGEFSGENMLGGTVTAPMIQADTIEVKSYMDAVVPTITEISPENAVSEQHGISLKVDKVEFAEEETRVYLTESNGSDDKFSMSTYSIKIVQNGKQIEQDTSSMSAYEGNYAELSSEILPNSSSSGVLVFPPMDSSTSFQIFAEGYSDDYETEFEPFTIDITP